MELYPDEVERLRGLIKEWTSNDTRELEATFSAPSDSTTFLAVAQRLASKGFTAIPQEDKLNIITPEQLRFTLTGLASVEKYCRDDDISSTEYEVMVKDRAGIESNLDLKEYGVRVKVRRELPLGRTDGAVNEMVQRWSTQKKAFRLIRRWTYMGKGVRFDISMVRSTPTGLKGEFKWQRKFQEHDLARERPRYEIEVELLRPSGKADEAKVLKELVAGIGEVLRGIQKHPFLIRKSTALKALQGYKNLVGLPLDRDARFRGVAPKAILKENMLKVRQDGVPNIRDGYNVTDKADGLRMMGFVDEAGELFLMDMSLTFYRTGLRRLACAESLVDGEYVTRDKDGNAISQYHIFDIYVAPGKVDCSQKPFKAAEGEDDRITLMNDWMNRWNKDTGPELIPGSGVIEKNKIMVALKQFIIAKAGDTEIFKACARVLTTLKPYHTDGLILTPNSLPLPAALGVTFKEQMKWKPADENTVDFLVVLDKDLDTGRDAVKEGVKPVTGENIRYKVMRLYVGSSTDPAYADPRSTVLFEQPLPGAGAGRKREYKPVLFNPSEFPDTMGAVSYVEVEVDESNGNDIIRCENDDPIQDKSIVECYYDGSAEPGWRWKPMRVRQDKTERFQRGIVGRTLNNEDAAEDVWKSIHDPVTQYMITTGGEAPSEKELSKSVSEAIRERGVSKVYYDRTAAKEDIELIRGLRAFHRVYIKEDILLGRALREEGRTLVDLACGQGGDLQTWIRNKASFVYGTDIAGNGIRDPQNGAYARYLKQVIRSGGFDRVPKMIFTIGSSAQNIKTGAAGATPEEANIMRVVYNGRGAANGPVPPFVEKFGAGKLTSGADAVAIMFAIHYFFENPSTLNSFIQNINDSLKMGGLFVGCCFDGQKVFDTLRDVKENGSIVGKEGDAEIWKITKRYAATDLTNTEESLGLPIDVEFISIGTENREYLVSFELLKRKMAEIGCDLLTLEECRALGLNNSTNLFEESYRMAGGDKKYPMSPTVKQYSFFNRWFIFKRRRGGMLEEEVEEELKAAEADVERTVVLEEEKKPEFATASERAIKERDATLRAASVGPSAAAAAGGGGDIQIKPVAGVKKTYKPTEVFKIGIEAKEDDKQLKIGEIHAARWLAPIAPFPITDIETKVEYPSLEHYMAAMKYKYSSKPGLGEALFSQSGTVHQKYLRQRATETGQGSTQMDPRRDYELYMAEYKEVRDEISSAGMKKRKAEPDVGAWEANKDKLLLDSVKQRFEKDARMRKILTAVKAKALYILYDSGEKGVPELGGKRLMTGAIEGENKVGKLLMDLTGIKY